MKVPDEIKRRDPISLLPRKLNEVIRYLRAARLVAGPGVRLRESTSGTTMTVETQPSGGSAGAPAGYSGYFKVIDASEYDDEGKLTSAKVRIVNGGHSSPDQPHVAGLVSAYAKTHEIPAQDIAVAGNAAADTYVYLRFTDVNAENPVEVVSSASAIQDDGLNDVLLIAQVEAGMKKIQQRLNTDTAVEIGNPYQGPFRIAPAGSGKYHVLGGETDIGTAAAAEVTLSAGSIYLIAQYAGGYTLTISATRPSGDYAFFELASVSSGVVRQVWNAGEIYFGERFWI